MGYYFKQISFNFILISILVAPMTVFAESSPGAEYFKALMEKKPKTRAEMDQIRKDTYDKAMINEANTLSKINADHTKKVEEDTRKAEAKAKKEEAAKAKNKPNSKSTTTVKSESKSENKSDIKVESNMPDEVDFNKPPKEKGADASAPTPVPSESN